MFLLPTFANFFEKLVEKLAIHKNFTVLFIKECKWKNIKKVGLGIVAFEGTEHLANIITEL
jgi:hypothetical protein